MTGLPPMPDVEEFFHNKGLTVLRVDHMSTWITQLVGGVARGVDGQLWTYGGGVWSPGDAVVGEAVYRLLRGHYMPRHLATMTSALHNNPELSRLSADARPEWIGFRNGDLHWRSGVLHDHDPARQMTVQLPHRWIEDDHDDAKEWSTFDTFLKTTMDPDVVPFVWTLLGLLMMNGSPHEKAVLLLGSGRNGKGSLIELIENLLGAGNISHVPLADFGGNRFSTANLYGRLANVAGDLDSTYLERTGVFKGVTGGDVVQGEMKFKSAFSFRPWATHLFSANAVPRSADVSVGYAERWIVVPFPRTFTAAERDPDVKARMRNPRLLEAVAVRAVDALRKLMVDQGGELEFPPSILTAHEEFCDALDPVRSWLRDEFLLDPAGEVRRAELSVSFDEWASRSGHSPMSARKLLERVRGTPGVGEKVRDGIRYVTGIRACSPVWPPVH